MKLLLLALLVFLLNTQFIFSQINLDQVHGHYNYGNESDLDTIQRSVFLFSSVGLIEILSLGVGYQITKDFSFAIKWSSTWIGSGAMILPNGASGYGIKLSYHKPFLIFNTASIEHILYTQSTLDWERKILYGKIDKIPTLKGYYLDFNVGRETINELGFNFFWAIGFCVSAAKEAHVLYAPSLKIGLSYNFIRIRSN